MFLTLKTPYFTGYADDNIPFAVRDKITDVKSSRGNKVKPFKLVFEQ